jgi:hypothetical protein
VQGEEGGVHACADAHDLRRGRWCRCGGQQGENGLRARACVCAVVRRCGGVVWRWGGREADLRGYRRISM